MFSSARCGLPRILVLVNWQMHIIIGVRGHHCYTQGCASQAAVAFSRLQVKAPVQHNCLSGGLDGASVCLPGKLHDLPAGTNPNNGKSPA